MTLRFKDLEIHNWCQHERMKVEFGDAPIIGIVGPNGCGKSNFCEAMRMLITGESANPGNKADNLRQGADSGSVAGSFFINDRECHAKRSITSAQCSLTYGPGKDDKVRKAKEVSEKLHSLLGVENNIIHSYVFIRQGTIDKVLFDRPGERKAEMLKLFGMAGTEKTRDHLQRELTAVQVVSHGPRIEELDRQLNELADRLAKTKTAYDAARQNVLPDEDVQKLKTLIETYNSGREATGELKALDAELQKTYARRDAASADVTAKEADVSDREAGEEERKSKETELRTFVSRAADIKRSKDRYQELIREVQSINVDDEALKPPEGDPEELKRSIESQNQRIAGLQMELLDARKFIDAFKTGQCPTCGSTIQNAQKLIKERQAFIEANEPLVKQGIQTRDETAQKLTNYQKRHGAWQLEQQRLKDRVTRIQKEMQELEPCQSQDVSQEAVDAANVQIADIVSAASALATARGELEGARKALAGVEEDVRSLLEQRSSVKARTEGCPDEDTVEAAKTQLDEHGAHYKAYADAKSEYDVAVERDRDIRRELEQLRQEEAKSEKLRRWRDLIDRARTVLHKDYLPAMVSTRYMSTLCLNLNKFLMVVESPFTVDMSDDMTFTCSFSDGRVMPHTRLSGGEKMVMAVCFRFAVNDLFAADLGLLALDEPTAYLDDSNVEHVAHLLENVRGYTTRSGMQIVVVTHERRLIPVIDKVIDFYSAKAA